MNPTERRVYAAITIILALLLVAGIGWGINAYIGHTVDARLRDARPIYTLECRPKE